MGRQKENLQSKRMEELKELNEMEVSKLSGTEFKTMVNKEAQGTHRQLQRTEWELQQYEKGNRNYKQEPGRNEQ